MQVLYGLGRLSVRTQIPLFHLIQTVLTISDVATVIATYLLMRVLGVGSRAFWYALIGFALNPISILMTCQQGNFDPGVGLLMVLACLALVAWNRGAVPSVWLLACLAVGLGVLAKSVPLITAPMLLTRWRETDWASRMIGAVLVIGPAALAVSVIYVLSPHIVASSIFGYRSNPGWFGISGLINLVAGEDAAKVYGRFFPLIGLAVLAAAILAFSRPRRICDTAIVLGCALLLWWVPTLGPGYGPQYIGWFLPLTVVLFAISRGWLRLSIGVFAAVALATYLEEYALVPTQGAFFRFLVPAATDLGTAISSQSAQTLLRLPLFLAYVGMVVAGVVTFARLRRGDVAPLNPSA
jgi:hypothetical protein